MESDDVEVGAVNCQTEQALCAERFNLRSYPTIRLLNRQRGMQQEYHNSLPLTTDAISTWAREVAVEWREWSYDVAAVVAANAAVARLWLPTAYLLLRMLNCWELRWL